MGHLTGCSGLATEKVAVGAGPPPPLAVAFLEQASRKAINEGAATAAAAPRTRKDRRLSSSRRRRWSCDSEDNACSRLFVSNECALRTTALSRPAPCRPR